jgi:hypothetical protein
LKKILLLVVLLLLMPELVQAEEDASRYIDSVGIRYSGLKDYTADVSVHFDIETFKAPDMQAKLYYKTPDKMKMESKRVFFFPKEGGYFNPSLFRKEDFEIKLLEHLTYAGGKAVKLRLTPKKTKTDNQYFVLTIDTEHNLIREMNVLQFGGREIKAVIAYGNFDSFELPTRIELRLDIPSMEPNEMRGFEQFGQGEKRMSGKIDITYSNYRVNSGLSDNIFRETAPLKSK